VTLLLEGLDKPDSFMQRSCILTISPRVASRAGARRMSVLSASRVRRAVWPFIIAGAVCCLVGIAEAQPVRVVVVPFRNVSGHPADQWIGIGIAETLAADLKVAGLMVDRGHTSMVRSVGSGEGAAKSMSPVDGVRQCDVSWVIDVTVQRIADQIRLIVRVLDPDTGRSVFSTKVDGAVPDLFDAQDRVVVAVTGWLATARTPGTGIGGVGRIAGSGGSDSTSATDVDVLNGVTGTLDLGQSSDRVAAGDTSQRRKPRQGGGGFAPSPMRERQTASVRRTATPPSIDGFLDDSAWDTAAHFTDFVQIAPGEGAPGSEETEVWITYDSDYLYFAFYAHYTDTGIMRVNRADRKEIRGDDRMSVLFDTFLDQQRAYQFEVNGYGVQADSLVNADGSTGFSRSGSSSSARRGGSGGSRGGSSSSVSGQFGIRGDQSWNALFDTSGRLIDDGWVAEMRIPFKSLRYPSRARGQGHRWGFQVTRIIRGKSEAQSWSPISRGVAGQITQFGQLQGMEDLSASRNLEFLPEVTGFRFGSLDTTDASYDPGDPSGDIGVGVKYGITPNLTADVTFNPDFSQIESDRPQVATNQRLALFFQEQRPFFLEGQEIFQTATPLTLLHTRTIIDPRLGGKLTGKVGQTTLGIMVADDEAAGLLDDPFDPRVGSTAQTFIGRARYDLYSESYLGAIMTAREFGADYNRVAGMDGRFRLGRTHRVNFLAMGSETQDHEFGSSSGPAFEADFSKQGRNLTYGAAYSSIDPEFETRTGFLPRVDLRQTSGNMGYRWWPESSILTWGPSVNYLRLYDHAGVLQDEQIQGLASFSFRNNISFTGMVNRDLERFQEVDFRKTGYGFFNGISSRLVSLFGGYNVGDGILYVDSPYLGILTSGNLNFRFQATSRLRTELRTVFSRFVNRADEMAVFDVKILRARTTYQFTDRFLFRHIMEHNTLDVTLGNNLLMTYRLNAGTVL